jgi:hypothetical protein
VSQVKLLRGKKQAVKLLAVNQPPPAKHISHQEKSGQKGHFHKKTADVNEERRRSEQVAARVVQRGQVRKHKTDKKIKHKKEKSVRAAVKSKVTVNIARELHPANRALPVFIKSV